MKRISTLCGMRNIFFRLTCNLSSFPMLTTPAIRLNRRIMVSVDTCNICDNSAGEHKEALKRDIDAGLLEVVEPAEEAGDAQP